MILSDHCSRHWMIDVLHVQFFDKIFTKNGADRFGPASRERQRAGEACCHVADRTEAVC